LDNREKRLGRKETKGGETSLNELLTQLQESREHRLKLAAVSNHNEEEKGEEDNAYSGVRRESLRENQDHGGEREDDDFKKGRPT